MTAEELFDSAVSLAKSRNPIKAKEVFNQIIDDYPASSEAEKAKLELERIFKGHYQGKEKWTIMPKRQFWMLVVVSTVIGYILHSEIIGKSPSAALGGAVGLSIGFIAFATIFAMIPAGIYWLVKRERMPGQTPLIWIIWALLFGSLFLQITGSV